MNRRLFYVAFLSAFTLFAISANYVTRDSQPENADSTFNAHDFALFRTSYEALKSQAVAPRAAHLHQLIEAAERPGLTRGMIENLADFARGIADSEESPVVRNEARLVLNEMNRKLDRTSVSAESENTARNLAAAERGGR